VVRIEWLDKTGMGPTVIDLRVRVKVFRKPKQPGDWVEVVVTAPTREGQLTLFQDELELGIPEK
jgi:hypothetical protein